MKYIVLKYLMYHLESNLIDEKIIKIFMVFFKDLIGCDPEKLYVKNIRRVEQKLTERKIHINQNKMNY